MLKWSYFGQSQIKYFKNRFPCLLLGFSRVTGRSHSHCRSPSRVGLEASLGLLRRGPGVLACGGVCLALTGRLADLQGGLRTPVGLAPTGPARHPGCSHPAAHMAVPRGGLAVFLPWNGQHTVKLACLLPTLTQSSPSLVSPGPVFQARMASKQGRKYLLLPKQRSGRRRTRGWGHLFRKRRQLLLEMWRVHLGSCCLVG